MTVKKKFFVAIAMLFCIPALINAQEQKPRIISGGVLNGKAISLPKPAYPQIARAAQASGPVVVQITIDEEGKVISATAISGHPLLKASAVQAAYGARFTPTLLEGMPVKVTGTINYNFLAALSWIHIGAELRRAEKDNNHRLNASVASSLYTRQFEAESNELNVLENTPKIYKDDVNTASPVIESKPKTSATKNEIPPVRKGVVTIVGTAGPNSAVTPIHSEEYMKKISDVINSLKNKLASDPINSWYFSLGLIIGEEVNAETIARFNNHLSIAPADAPEFITSRLQQLVTYSNKSSFDENDKGEINRLIREILNAPIQKV